MCGACGFDHGFVFGGILVGFEQDFVELRLDGGGASALAQLGCPRLNLCLDLFFLFDARECLGNHFGRGFFEATFARAAKVMRRFVQAKQCCGLFGEGGLCAEVFAGQVSKAKLVFGGELPSKV